MTKKNQNLPMPYVPSNETIYGESDSVNAKDFVIGVLVGGIIGAAAGLLLAPKAGSEIRSVAATQAVKLKDKSVALSSTAKDKTVQLSSQLKEQSSHLVEKVKTKTQKTAPVLDDGTVSSEGEETLEEFVTSAESTEPSVEEAVLEVLSEEEMIAKDIAALSRPTSI
jgi:gas vesicle protein